MNASIMKGVQETIISMFDKLTTEHTWYPECKKNVHYYNGWKTNIAHKVNYKVIIPCYNVFDTAYKWSSGEFRTYKAREVLEKQNASSCWYSMPGRMSLDDVEDILIK